MESTQPRKNAARKANFCQAEVSNAWKKYNLVRRWLQNNINNRLKAEAWWKVTEALNVRGVAVRSVDDVKKKWKGVKSDTTQAVRNQKKTGGGPEEKPSIYAELVFSIIGEDSEGVHGIEHSEGVHGIEHSEGVHGTVRVSTASNTLRVSTASNTARVSTASNTARVSTASNTARVSTASNTARVSTASNTARVSTASNTARVSTASNTARVSTASNTARVSTASMVGHRHSLVDVVVV